MPNGYLMNALPSPGQPGAGQQQPAGPPKLSLKEKFGLAAMWARTIIGGAALVALGIYGVYQYRTTSYDYQQLREDYPGGYPFYAIGDTFYDGKWLASRIPAWGARLQSWWTGKPDISELRNQIA